MLIRAATIISFLALSGCNISGDYRSEGPCKGFNRDQVSCEQAYKNSQTAPNVKIGQSMNEVSRIMGGPPATREATSGREEWSYLIGYENGTSMVVVFENEVVVEIKQERL